MASRAAAGPLLCGGGWVKHLIEYLEKRLVLNANWFCIVKLHQKGGLLPFFSKTMVISGEVKEQNSFDKG